MALHVQLVVSALCVQSNKIYVLVFEDSDHNMFLPNIFLPTSELTLDSVTYAANRMFAKIFSLPAFFIKNAKSLIMQDNDTGSIVLHHPFFTRECIRIFHPHMKHLRDLNEMIQETRRPTTYSIHLFIGLLILVALFSFGLLNSMFETLYLVIPICAISFMYASKCQSDDIITQSYILLNDVQQISWRQLDAYIKQESHRCIHHEADFIRKDVIGKHRAWIRQPFEQKSLHLMEK